MITVFLDTNIYLHAKPVQDIPWKDLLGEDVTILIPRITVQELDEQKDTNTKQTTRDRARKVLKQIETWTSPTALRDGVTITYLHDEPSDLPTGFRRDRNDDVLVATILYYQATRPNEHITLITNDTGPRLSAKHHGINAQPLLDDHLLPRTPDPIEQENQRLKQQLQDLQSAAPQLQVTLNGEAKMLNVVPLATAPAALDDEEINTKAAAARQELPWFTPSGDPEPESNFRRVNGKLVFDLKRQVTWNPNSISSVEYTRYDADCATYKEDYRNYLREQHQTQVRRAQTFKLAVILHNDGGKPAEDIRITLTFPKHVEITTHASSSGGPPPKPTPPRSGAEMMNETIQRGFGIDSYTPNFMPDINPAQRGPWIKENTAEWWIRTLQHGFEWEIETIYIKLDAEQRPFEITATIHAANVVKAVTQRIVVKRSQRKN
jgi:hypothetical protein